MCKCSLPCVITSNNGTQFTNATVVDIWHDLRVHTQLIFVVHSLASRQTKSTNKWILKGIKKKLDDAKGLYVEQLHELLWSLSRHEK